MNNIVLSPKKIIYRLILLSLIALSPLSEINNTDTNTAFSAQSSEAVAIWWPQDGSTISGTQPFKAVLSNRSIDSYTMYWQVDNGNLVPMGTSTIDYPHKEAIVDVRNWTWRDTRAYQVNFVAKDLSGNTVAQKTITVINQDQRVLPPAPVSTIEQNAVSIWWPSNNAQVQGTQNFKAVLDNMSVDQYRMYVSINGSVRQEMQTSSDGYPHKEIAIDVGNVQTNTHQATFTATDLQGNTIGQNTVTYTAIASAPPAIPVVSQSSSNAFAGEEFYVNPYSNAKRQATEWQYSRPDDAVQLNKIGNQADAEWFGNWNADIEHDVRAYVAKARAQGGSLPVMVSYNIPQRDCGGYSAGGANTPTTYQAWIRAFARGIGTDKAVVILEPDALPGMGCLNTVDQDMRLSLLKDAVQVFKSAGNTAVYIDAGHANWNNANDTAARLYKAGISQADGFSLNISNFIATPDNITFGTLVSDLTGGKHFVIDTSRNGNGSNGEWCNPSGRALGSAPSASTGNSLVDAYFWIKKPGDSDGGCNGAPSAGTWMPEYALELSRNTQ
jgi:endoglucanase